MNQEGELVEKEQSFSYKDIKMRDIFQWVRYAFLRVSIVIMIILGFTFFTFGKGAPPNPFNTPKPLGPPEPPPTPIDESAGVLLGLGIIYAIYRIIRFRNKNLYISSK